MRVACGFVLLTALAICGCGTTFFAVVEDSNGEPLRDARVSVQTPRMMDVMLLKHGSSDTDDQGRTGPIRIERFEDRQELLIEIRSDSVGDWYILTGPITTPLSPTGFKLRQLIADQVDEADHPTIMLWSKN